MSGIKIMVGRNFSACITTHSKLPFEIKNIALSAKPLDAVVNGRRVRYTESSDGYYEFNPLEPVIMPPGQWTVATLDIWGPEKGKKVEFFIRLDGNIEIQGEIFNVQTYTGAYSIERDSKLKMLKDITIKALHFSINVIKILPGVKAAGELGSFFINEFFKEKK